MHKSDREKPGILCAIVYKVLPKKILLLLPICDGRTEGLFLIQSQLQASTCGPWPEVEGTLAANETVD
jgi:hypothetical protein